MRIGALSTFETMEEEEEAALPTSKDARTTSNKQLEGESIASNYVKRSRKNTVAEKRQMRKARKQRKRFFRRNLPFEGLSQETAEIKMESLTKELAVEKKARSELEQTSHLNRKMAKSYWERWRHELDERKRLQAQVLEHKFCITHCKESKYSRSRSTDIPIINRSLLTLPHDKSSDLDAYVGRGSFGIVKHQLYRGIHVAVKEFLPRTCMESVHQEASFLLRFGHPYLPLLIGSARPYCMVMQYYGIDGESITLQKELQQNTIMLSYRVWLILCAQIVEAMRYLHQDVKIIHNDFKTDNILLSRSPAGCQVQEFLCEYQIVIIDFGKATDSTKGCKYELSYSEKQKYYREFHHIAPELVEGKTKQTEQSDIFALGKVLAKIHFKIESLDTLEKPQLLCTAKNCITKCTSREATSRPKIASIAKVYKDMLT